MTNDQTPMTNEMPKNLNDQTRFGNLEIRI